MLKHAASKIFSKNGVAVLVCYMLLGACQSNEKGDMPYFTLKLTDNYTLLNTAQIPEGNPIILMFYSPDCEHCKQETETLLKHMDSLKNVLFYFISIEPMDEIIAFKADYKLAQYPNIILGRDYQFSLPKYFELNTTPFLALYNKHKQLKFLSNGEVKASRIIKEVKKLH